MVAGRRLVAVVLACLAGALAACGGGAAPAGSVAAPAVGPAASASPAAPADAAPPAGRVELPTDATIAELLYTDRQRVPAGFHVEASRADGAYATVAHLRNVDLDPTATPPHELCAADFATALEWSERAAAAQPVYGDLVGNDATVRAYEFTRRLRTTPARTAVVRVFRCEYLDRAGVDLRAPEGPAGRFRLAGWTGADVRALGEYLWTFGVDNNAGRVVLSSTVAETTAGATHAILLARLVRAVPPAACDRVELWREDLQATRPSGALLRTATPLRAFLVRRVDGVAQTCG